METFFFFFSPGLHWLPPPGLQWFAVNISWVKSLAGKSHVYFGREHIVTVFTCPCSKFLLHLHNICIGLNSYAKACEMSRFYDLDIVHPCFFFCFFFFSRITVNLVIDWYDFCLPLMIIISLLFKSLGWVRYLKEKNNKKINKWIQQGWSIWSKVTEKTLIQNISILNKHSVHQIILKKMNYSFQKNTQHNCFQHWW